MQRPRGKIRYLVGTRLKYLFKMSQIFNKGRERRVYILETHMSRMRNFPTIHPAIKQEARDAKRPPSEATLNPSAAHVLSVTVDARVKSNRT